MEKLKSNANPYRKYSLHEIFEFIEPKIDEVTGILWKIMRIASMTVKNDIFGIKDMRRTEDEDDDDI